jgi:hypothetical protein
MAHPLFHLFKRAFEILPGDVMKYCGRNYNVIKVDVGRRHTDIRTTEGPFTLLNNIYFECISKVNSKHDNPSIHVRNILPEGFESEPELLSLY